MQKRQTKQNLQYKGVPNSIACSVLSFLNSFSVFQAPISKNRCSIAYVYGSIEERCV